MDEIAVNESDLPWEKAPNYPEGTDWKVLCRGLEGMPKVALLRLPPSFAMDVHAHVYAEHQYVLEGQYESRGERFPAGSYRLIPQHKDHGPFTSANGARMLVVWEN